MVEGDVEERILSPIRLTRAGFDKSRTLAGFGGQEQRLHVIVRRIRRMPQFQLFASIKASAVNTQDDVFIPQSRRINVSV
jgi:hypothetical protein